MSRCHLQQYSGTEVSFNLIFANTQDTSEFAARFIWLCGGVRSLPSPSETDMTHHEQLYASFTVEPDVG